MGQDCYICVSYFAYILFSTIQNTHLEVMQKEKERYQNFILYRTRHVMIHPTPKLGN